MGYKYFFKIVFWICIVLSTRCAKNVTTTENKFQVTFDKNGASGNAPLSSSYLKNSKITLPKNDLATFFSVDNGNLFKKDHVFLGWDLNASTIIPLYKSGDTYTIPDKDIIFYAIWWLNVKFDGNGATKGLPPTYIEYVPGMDITLPSNTSNLQVSNNNSTFIRPGYTFLGWDTNSTATVPTYLPQTRYTIPEEPTIFYAIWQETR